MGVITAAHIASGIPFAAIIPSITAPTSVTGILLIVAYAVENNPYISPITSAVLVNEPITPDAASTPAFAQLFMRGAAFSMAI